ncbi:hypothetical protein B0T17DRAFT_65149 [Bombardia bombarda]|uniref:Kelch repeat-containing protein n=1 Tax=Bombardia bombarda TaxID=252184 RepID=A0AA39XL78_9PEZI|nr:hypothetical protein B0T17DRAFT_65149 [Bombardia bombarda]
MATRMLSVFTLAVLTSLPRLASCDQGDICYITGVKTALVNDRLYFHSGNYSVVSGKSQKVSQTASLYSIPLDQSFPVEKGIPKASLENITISPDIKVAYNSAFPKESYHAAGALWSTNDTLYFFGGGFETPTNLLSSYNIETGLWNNVEVAGGKFAYGERVSAQYASTPDTGLHFAFGGTTEFGGTHPYGKGLIRFDSNTLSWTNETLGNGSNGIDLPNLESGVMVYIPAGKEGMLVAFGGANQTAGINPKYGDWTFDSDWTTIYVYDIESHTWWAQDASGDAPANRGTVCTAVSMSEDGESIHITTYGGWSFLKARAYEDVFVLSIPSFRWTDVSKVTNRNNADITAGGTNIGRDSLQDGCQTYRGSQMVLLGGSVRDGYKFEGGVCTADYQPVRVLDLSKYEWKTELDTTATYQVPPVIYNVIGGGPTGGATVKAPDFGWADPTLASLITMRVGVAAASTSDTPTSTDPPSPTASNNSDAAKTSDTPATSSSSSNTGAIAGGVVGGVAAIALIATAIWFFLRRRRGQDADDDLPPVNTSDAYSYYPPPKQADVIQQKQQYEAYNPHELHASHGPTELGQGEFHEMPADYAPPPPHVGGGENTLGSPSVYGPGGGPHHSNDMSARYV